MDLRTEILKEHSKAQTLRIVAYVGKDKNRMDELMQLFLSKEYRVTQRAAWPLCYIGLQHPQLIKPYQGELLNILKQEDVQDAVKRNILRIWVEHMPPETFWGEIFDRCDQLARSKDEAVAIRVFAMHILGNIAFTYPELRPEVKSLIEDMMLLGQAAFVARGKKVLKLLSRNKK